MAMPVAPATRVRRRDCRVKRMVVLSVENAAHRRRATGSHRTPAGPDKRFTLALGNDSVTCWTHPTGPTLQTFKSYTQAGGAG
ncbi:hypothetical protein GCM10028777_21390 [Angustibacter speluncae]